jgi:O-antigen/teichoic acid export membrane protein
MILSVPAQCGAAFRWLLHSRHAAASIAQTIAARFMLAGMSVVTGIITARALGATGRGEQTAMGLWPLIIPYLLTLGMSTAVRYCIRRQPERSAELFTVAMLVATVMSVVAIGVGVVFIPHWLHEYSGSVVRQAQFMMLFAPQVALTLILTAMLETQGDFKLANSTRVISTVLTLASLTVMAFMHVLTPSLTTLTYFVPPMLTSAWVAWKLRAFFARRLFDPRPGLKILGSYGLRSYGVDVLATLSQQIDQVLVVGLLSASAMGVYAIALSASRVLQLLHQAVVTVIFPNASGLAQERVVPVVARAARVSTVIATLFSAILAAALPFLIPLFYGRGYAGAIGVAQVLTLEALIGGLVYVLAQAFMASNRPGLVTAFQGLGFCVAVPCMLVLMPHFGLMGAAVALLISTCARLAFLLASFRMILHVPMPQLIPTADDLVSFRRALAARI